MRSVIGFHICIDKTKNMKNAIAYMDTMRRKVSIRNLNIHKWIRPILTFFFTCVKVPQQLFHFDVPLKKLLLGQGGRDDSIAAISPVRKPERKSSSRLRLKSFIALIFYRQHGINQPTKVKPGN